jgi:hypothetical protein
LWRFSLPEAESQMRTCKKFTSRSGCGETRCSSAPAWTRTQTSLKVQLAVRVRDSAASFGSGPFQPE